MSDPVRTNENVLVISLVSLVYEVEAKSDPEVPALLDSA